MAQVTPPTGKDYTDMFDYNSLNDENILYAENEYIKLGINLALGGAVTYLAEHGKPNMINSFDWGRQIQLSFYGYPKYFCPEGVEISTDWAHAGWNPISCGDCFGNRSKILESRSENGEIYVKCIPMQWALNNWPGDCTFETWYKLDGTKVHVVSQINNAREDKNQYPACGQELPAVYTNGVWWKAVSYVGLEPYTGAPVTEMYGMEDECWPTRSFKATEHWSALVDNDNYGLGIWMPSTVQFASGCHDKRAVGGPKDNPCGYIGPNQREILDHDIQYAFNYTLIVGDVAHIRAQANALSAAAGDDLHWKFDGTRDHFWYENITDAGVPRNGYLEFDFAAGGKLMCPPQYIPAGKTRVVLDAAIDGDVPVVVRRDKYSGVYRNSANRGIPSEDERVTVEAAGRLTGDGQRKKYVLELGIAMPSIGFELEFGGEGHARIWAVDVE